jgi:hypothetical protein
MNERRLQVQNVDCMACSFPVYWEWAESKAAQPVEGRCTYVLKPYLTGDNTAYVTQASR